METSNNVLRTVTKQVLLICFYST